MNHYFFAHFFEQYKWTLFFGGDENDKNLQPYLDFDKIYLVFYKKSPYKYYLENDSVMRTLKVKNYEDKDNIICYVTLTVVEVESFKAKFLSINKNNYDDKYPHLEESVS